MIAIAARAGVAPISAAVAPAIPAAAAFAFGMSGGRHDLAPAGKAKVIGRGDQGQYSGGSQGKQANAVQG
ncbi:hypothetical protein MesoLj113b_59580 [Mesorhizobium sp. 113-3-3]|nr:hypothetical protein MesoLj113b_59580 [Mesorhizobium sp. 113-3-3]